MDGLAREHGWMGGAGVIAPWGNISNPLRPVLVMFSDPC